MKQLDAERDQERSTAELCLDTGIRIMRLLRRSFREAPDATLALSAVRALAFVKDNPRASLSDLAGHLSVGAPTASKLVDQLVERGLIDRSADPDDRRRLALVVNAEGRRALRQAARPAEDRLGVMLERLSKEDQRKVRTGMEKLLPLLRAAAEESTDA